MMLTARFFVTLRSLLALTVLLPALGWAASASEYELGPQDRVRITIVEWTLDELRSPINGEYTVGAGGNVSLPLLGPVQAGGVPVSKFAATVSRLVQEKLQLSQRPNTSVEVVQFRPFYILGEISSPGEYAYRPGMTVLQAVTLAGGLPRPMAGLLQAEREIVTERATIAASLASITELVARQARLQAELAGSDTIAFPEEITERKQIPEVAQIIATEEMLFDARKAMLSLAAQSEDKLEKLFQQEQEALELHSEALRAQLESIEGQLVVIRRLRDQGLGSPAREFELERAASETQGKLWDVNAQGVRAQREFAAQQEIKQRSVVELRQQIANELNDVKARLSAARNQASTSEDLIRLTQLHWSLEGSARYTIVREDPKKADGALIETAATESTRIRPGDVLKIAIDRGAPSNPDSVLSSKEPVPEGSPRPGRDDQDEARIALPAGEGRAQ